MAEPRLIIHIGARPLALTLTADFQYEWAASASENLSEGPLFVGDDLNWPFATAVFLLDDTSPWRDAPQRLAALPANAILVDTRAQFSTAAKEVLALKGAHRLNFSDAAALANTIAIGFWPGQDGWRLDPDSFTLAPDFTGTVKTMGHVYQELAIDAPDWQVVAYPNYAQWVPAGEEKHVRVEYQVAGAASVRVTLGLYHPDTNAHLDDLVLEAPALRGGFTIPASATGCNVQVIVAAKGHGQLRLGAIHMRRSRGEFGEFMVNDRRLVEPKGMNSDLSVYFDAGDMQPPLTVYFSGYRSAEGFEGTGMMKSFGAPFLVFADSRLEGGAFYLGSDALQQEVVATIRQTLERLHFKPSDLILSGLSMGTFGTLYYGAKLNPSAIIVGKPLVNIGTVAAGARLIRPAEFATSLDMVLLYEGDAGRADSLNDRFWRVFNRGDFSHTTFAIAYMQDDDYDPQAYSQLRAGLRDRFPAARVLTKALPGRHNDDTNGIVNWFVAQYRHLLAQQFDRKFE